MTMSAPVHLEVVDGDDGIERDDAPVPVDAATWFKASAEDDSVQFQVPDGGLPDEGDLALDLLLTGEESAKFQLAMSTGDEETFEFRFRLLPGCEARARLPLAAIADDSLTFGREGAVLQRRAGGDRFDPSRVERIELTLARATSTPVRWCATALRVGCDEPALSSPVLPDGPLLDEFGQFTRKAWDGRTNSERDLRDRLRRQRATATERSRAADRSEWGGWLDGPDFEATGRFRVERTDDRWWLVDPDGNPFWANGVCCVRPYPETAYDGLEDALRWIPDRDGKFAPAFEATNIEDGHGVNYLVANLIRAFGPEDWRHAWQEVAGSELLRLGVTTVGAYSDWEWASDAGWPYVRTLSLDFDGVQSIAWDFPDVFAPAFDDAAETIAAPLEETVGDPGLIGYFLGNEPDWAWTDELPAWQMLRSTEVCATRSTFADWLRDHYKSAAELADVWGVDCTFADVESGSWDQSRPEGAESDLNAFSELMAERYFETLVEACSAIDPDHLCLGTRFPWAPPEWARAGMASFDVLCVNCFQPTVPEAYGDLCERLQAPVLIGEFLFGALDVGLPAPGVQWVPDQESRGAAYRVYVEDVAAKTWCVGAHWYGLYDQSALGKDNGANFNVGIYDVCGRPYDDLLGAVRSSSERIYDLAAGQAESYEDEPEYLGIYF